MEKIKDSASSIIHKDDLLKLVHSLNEEDKEGDSIKEDEIIKKLFEDSLFYAENFCDYINYDSSDVSFFISNKSDIYVDYDSIEINFASFKDALYEYMHTFLTESIKEMKKNQEVE